MPEGPGLDDGQIAALRDSLFPEIVRLAYRGTAFLEHIHGRGELVAGRRGVLIDLERRGPETVPQMARSRAVSRQYVQRIVNSLAEDGLVETARNPAHRRSPLIRITPAGTALVEAILEREHQELASLPLAASEDELRAAAALLQRIVAAFDEAGLDRGPD